MVNMSHLKLMKKAKYSKEEVFNYIDSCMEYDIFNWIDDNIFCEQGFMKSDTSFCVSQEYQFGDYENSKELDFDEPYAVLFLNIDCKRKTIHPFLITDDDGTGWEWWATDYFAKWRNLEELEDKVFSTLDSFRINEDNVNDWEYHFDDYIWKNHDYFHSVVNDTRIINNIESEDWKYQIQDLTFNVLRKAELPYDTCTIKDFDLDRVYLDVDGEEMDIRMWNIEEAENGLQLGITYTLFLFTDEETIRMDEGMWHVSKEYKINE